MAIVNCLDLSTGHLAPGDPGLLESGQPFPVRITSHEHGWIVHLPDRPSLPDEQAFLAAGLSPAFYGVLRHAYAHDCFLINFDCAGDPVEGLELYEW